MEEYTIDISGFNLIQKKGLQSTTLDSILISNYVNINLKSKNILDIGSGFGIISLILAKKSKAKVLGVEINKEAYNISIRNKENSKLYNIDFENIDILDYKNRFKDQSFDIIVSNPPYFVENNKNQMKKELDYRLARVEDKLTINKIIEISNYLLKNKGSLYIIFRTERLIEIIGYLSRYNMKIKRLKPVYTKINRNEALLSMVEIIKDGKEGFILEEPIYIYDEDGEKSEYIKSIYRG